MNSIFIAFSWFRIVQFSPYLNQVIMHGLGLGLIQAKTSPDPRKDYYEGRAQNTSTKWRDD